MIAVITEHPLSVIRHLGQQLLRLRLTDRAGVGREIGQRQTGQDRQRRKPRVRVGIGPGISPAQGKGQGRGRGGGVGHTLTLAGLGRA